MMCYLVKSDVAGGATNTVRPLTHPLDQTKEGLAVDATREQEEWRPIVGATDYEVSSLGRVRSLDRHRGHGASRRLLRGKVLKARLDSRGYFMVLITMDSGKRRNLSVHRQMCIAFHGQPPSPSHEARHLNDVKTDNRLDNLAWGTKSQNALDAVRNKRHHKSRRTHCPRGHEYSPRPTLNGNMRRRCNECRHKPPVEPEPRICAIAGCDLPHHSRDWCRIHYRHWWRFGDPLAGVFGRGGDRTAAKGIAQE